MKYFSEEDIFGVNGKNITKTVKVRELVNSDSFLLKLHNEILITEGTRNFEINSTCVDYNNCLNIGIIISGKDLPIEHNKILKCNFDDIYSDLLISDIIISASKYLNKNELDIRELIGISGTIEVSIDQKGTAVARNKMSNVKILQYNKKYSIERSDQIEDVQNIIKDCEDSSIKLDIVNEFTNGYVNKDHYQVKGSTFERFSATKTFGTNITKDIFEEQLASILQMKVIPNQIFIHEDMMDLTFWPRKYFYFKNKTEYLKLMLKFADFIEGSGIEGLKVNLGSLDDSAEEPINDLEVRKDIEFNKHEFGSNQIYVCGDISMKIKHEN